MPIAVRQDYEEMHNKDVRRYEKELSNWKSKYDTLKHSTKKEIKVRTREMKM
jgi:hypothetical protein